MAGLTKKGKTYYALIYVNGKTKWKRIGRVSYKDAKQYLRKLELDYEYNAKGVIEPKTITFSEFSQEYLNYSKANKAQASWERDITSLVALSNHFGDLQLQQIDNKEIEDYKSKRQREGRKNRTINIELTCLSVMLKKDIDWHYINALPTIKKLKEFRKPPRYLTNIEINHLLDSATLWMKYILLVLRNTGLRSKQLRELKLEYADFDRSVLVVMNTKGNNYYTISMNEELKTTLLYLRDNYISPLGKASRRKKYQREYFFCAPNGQMIKSFKNSFSKAVKRAGLKNVTPHVLRHTFASHLVMNGVDLPTVKELLGHQSITTTMIYSHLSDEHKAKAVNKLSWLNEPKLKLVEK